MNDARRRILAWSEQGALAPERTEAALRLAGVLPAPRDWRPFLERLLLGGGVLATTSGVVFFFAFNWAALGHYAKFALAELLLAAALLVYARAANDSLPGRAALLAAALLAGALFALFGQVYQTGADPWQLFALWAAAILPWTLVGRMPLLWLLCFALLNLAVALYFQVRTGSFLWLLTASRQFWSLFLLNLLALAGWEAASLRGAAWLQGRWLPRLLALACGGSLTWLVVLRLWDDPARSLLPALLAYAGWNVLVYGYYRRYRCDLFVLSAALLNLVVVVAASLGRLLLDRGGEAGAFLLIALVVLGLSAAGGAWLKQVTQEVRP